MPLDEAVVFERSAVWRESTATLRTQLLKVLTATGVVAGEPFASDTELMRRSGLSRKTVRRALDGLAREGWIVRRPGIGTFVGPRVTLRKPGRSIVPHAVGDASIGIGVLMSLSMRTHWYLRGVLDGLDVAASERNGVRLELLGDRFQGDATLVSRRLLSAPPDALVLTNANIGQLGRYAAEAQRLGIPCLGVGTRAMQLGLGGACEDGTQGVELAVAHLVGLGHRNIGLLAYEEVAPWAFDRVRGFRRGLATAGLPPDENRILWLPATPDADTRPRIERFLDERRPTALILAAAYHAAPTVGAIIAERRLSVPDDLSVVVFDQYTDGEPWLGGRVPTVVAQPFIEMCRHVVRIATAAKDDPAAAREQVRLPCHLIEGASTGHPRVASTQ